MSTEKGRRPLSLHLLIMLGYSVFFIVLGFVVTSEITIPLNWLVLAAHIVYLLIAGIAKLLGELDRKMGAQLLLAGLVVALVGHGLCFFNGLMHFGEGGIH